MNDEARFSVAAYAVISKDGDVLLTRRRGTEDWVLPGGTVEEGEAPWESVTREVREETGLEIDVGRLVGVYTKRRESDLVFVFGVSSVRGEPRSSDERDRVVFVAPDRLPPGTSGRDRERIADALAEHEEPILAVQASDGRRPSPGTR